MKTIIKTGAAVAALFFFQSAEAQLGLGVRNTTSVATNATLNATRATAAAAQVAARTTAATTQVTNATVNATRATVNSSSQAANKLRSGTQVQAGVEASSASSINSNAGGEERGLIRADARSEAELHANANAKLPFRETAEVVGDQKDMAKEKVENVKAKAEATKEAGLQKAKDAKTKVKDAKPSVSASGEVKATGSARTGKE